MSVRRASDFYPTPIPVIKNFLDNHAIKEGNILEPCAGNGNIIVALKERYNNHITAIEIRDEKDNLQHSGADEILIEDFLNYCPAKEYKTIISNPPFSLATEVINKCFEIACADTEIIMLLRLAFLEAERRYKFWQKHPVNDLYVLSKRPSFTGKGTDATAYGWFVWNKSKNQKIKVIRGR